MYTTVQRQGTCSIDFIIAMQWCLSKFLIFITGLISGVTLRIVVSV